MQVLQSTVTKGKRVTFLEHQGKKFRVLYYQVGRSSPDYYSPRFKTDLLTNAGWTLLADDTDIGFKRSRYPDMDEHEQNAEDFLAAMQAFIEMLYS